MRDHLIEFLNFCRRPTLLAVVENETSWTQKIYLVFVLSFLAFIPSLLHNILSSEFHSPETNRIMDLFLSDPVIANAGLSLLASGILLGLGMLIAIPLLALPEELAFRLPLKIRKWPIIVGFSLVSFYVFPAIYVLLHGGESIWAIVVTVVPILLFFILALTYRYFGVGLEGVLTKYFHYYAWALILLFSFIHTANPVDGASNVTLRSFLYGLFTIPSALTFSYLRVRFGFWWALLSHTFTNIFAITLIGLFFL